METNIKWTIETYAAHNEALREADIRFQKERDRRYKETEQIREESHFTALALSKEIQDYKNKKEAEFRDDILKYTSRKEGKELGTDRIAAYIIAILAILSTILNIFY